LLTYDSSCDSKILQSDPLMTLSVWKYAHLHMMGTGQKPPGQKAPWKKTSNNEIIIQSYYICFFIDGDIKRYFKELIQKIKYFKNIFFHILFIVKIFFIFYNMIQDFFLPLYVNSFIFGTWRYHKQLKYLFKNYDNPHQRK
jgi:hypothetical protein